MDKCLFSGSAGNGDVTKLILKSGWMRKKENMKTNKEVIDALENYFMQQDPKIIARTLAACMIDFNRLMNFDELGKNEQECLRYRLQKNMEELGKFVENDPTENKKFRCINIETFDE